MRLPVRILISLAVSSASAAVAAADAATPPTGATPSGWSRWQGRILLGSASGDAGRLGVPAARKPFESASLMGDYYFGRSLVPAGQLGGLRATSGLLFGPRASFALGEASRVDGSEFGFARRTLASSPRLAGSDASSDGATTVPYLGLGYTGLSVRGGWAYSADLGLAGGSTRLGHPAAAGPSLDDAIRDLRMTPMVQLGISYAF